MKSDTEIENIAKSEVGTEPTINWDKVFKKLGAIIAIIGGLMAILAFMWTIHKELAELNYRQGLVEGQLKILLESKDESVENKLRLLERDIIDLRNEKEEINR